MPSLPEISQSKWNRAQVELLEFGYDIEKVLGSGSWGTVVQAFAIDGPETTLAVKIIDRSCLDEESWKSIEREIDAMSCLDEHASIVQLIQVFETYNFVYLVMEFCSEGDLLSFVQESKTGLKEPQARTIFKQVLEACHHAHKNSYVHRDIKLENIFLAEGSSVRLGDWGFARRMEKGQKVNEYCGSVHYSAPEICLGKPYEGFGVDVWSLGVTLYALNSGLLPFWGADEHMIVRKILAGSYGMADSFSETLKDLISKALEVDPAKRITVEEMLEHPWVQGMSLFKKSPVPVTILSRERSQSDHVALKPKPVQLGFQSMAVPKLNLEGVTPTPAKVEDPRQEPLASARRTARFIDLPLLKSPRPRISPMVAIEQDQILTGRPSVMQLSARLAAQEKQNPRKVTKLQGFLDTIGAIIKKKNAERKELRLSLTKRELRPQLGNNKRCTTTRD